MARSPALRPAPVRTPDSASLDRMNALGASVRAGAVSFRVWAPRCRSVELVVDGVPALAMRRDEDVFSAVVDDLAAGARYQYRLDGARYRPDPASRWQPDGVHGPSAVVDPLTFPWTDQAFAGHALADLVFYELHVGTFTPAGTFEAVIPHLDRLVDLGVTAIELMPIAEFPGSRNWGYDGVHLYAPQSTYGGPEGLRRLVDAAHGRGLSVVLDIVYNHLGPEGNYLAEYGPYFTERYKTPWGAAMNFDGPDAAGVRRHYVENARYWVREFHVDGFRLDAIHAIYDASARHILTEVAEGARDEGRGLGRPVHVVAESHDNDRALVLRPTEGGIGLDAVWSDDFHHALHVLLTRESTGYYTDFGGPGRLARAIAEGFVYQGEPSEYFGRPRGTPSADLPGERFVVCIQNHDQVGNRALADRLSTTLPFEAVKLAVALMFTAPALPLLFMGEEYGETAPFQYFTSFLDPGLTEAVRRGRAVEFARFAWGRPIPDPDAPGTFVASRLNHALAEAPRHRELHRYYREWLALRRSHPALGARGKSLTRATLNAAGEVLTVTRAGAGGERIVLTANLTGEPRPLAIPRGGRRLLDSAEARFGGGGAGSPLAPYQVLLDEATQ
jgi:maltooligosyltrehalose trehalohydrolase